MILLHRLAAHHFKQLRDIELRLPDSGSVLIEGHNEAGKSSLFEAVFFALFGKPLSSERDYGIGDLKRYGADAMEVALDFSIAGRAFSIVRRYGKNHTAKLTAPGENGGETISSLSEIRKRLSDELSLSPDALLNTCFVEQKRLERLEDMNRDARRDAINELLNLKVLTDLEARFKINREARDEVERQKQRVAIASLDASLPALENDIGRAERGLANARYREARNAVEALNAKIEAAHHEQTEIEAQRRDVTNRLEAATQIAARLQFLNGELALRLAAWQATESTLDAAEQERRELQERAALLPQRAQALEAHRELAREYLEFQNQTQSLEAIHAFLERRAELEKRLNVSRQTLQDARDEAQTTKLPVTFFIVLLLAAVGIVVGAILRAPFLSIFFALAPGSVGGVLWLRHRAAVSELQSRAQQNEQAVAIVEGEGRALETHRPTFLQGKSTAQIEEWLSEYSAREHYRAKLQERLSKNALPCEVQALQSHLAVEENEVERERQVVSRIAILQEKIAGKISECEGAREQFEQAYRRMEKTGEAPLALSTAAQRLEELRREIETQIANQDANVLSKQGEELQAEYSALDRRIATWQHERDAHQAALTTLQADERDDVEQRSIAEWDHALRQAREALIHHRADRRAAAQTLEIGDDALNFEIETNKLNEFQEGLAVKRYAGEIVAKTRADIVSRVMPLTIANVRRVLPLLTEGRYRDVQWDEESNALAVYDALAHDFVRKRVFSGGARDQISLALRLAFALATLPGEHNIRPGFLFLDEPLSSFDRARTQALVELLTRGLIRQSFQQIFLVSHSQSFDPALFDYRLRMEGGRVIESTLP